MRFHNNNIGPLSPKRILRLWLISLRTGPFVVKTHQGPGRLFRLFVLLRMIRVAYSYRDPRDVVLSALDHGRKLRDKGQNHTFAQMVRFEDAFDTFRRNWLPIWQAYARASNVRAVRYEDLMEDPFLVVRTLLDHLGLKLSDDTLREILHRWDRENVPPDQVANLHLNRARASRYLSEMPEEQKAHFAQELGPLLQQMGYPV